MAFKLNKNDRRALALLAEYRLLTTGQMAVLLDKNRQALRRRLRDLESAGVVQLLVGGCWRERGRPENIVELAASGIDELKKTGSLPPQVPDDRLRGIGERRQYRLGAASAGRWGKRPHTWYHGRPPWHRVEFPAAGMAVPAPRPQAHRQMIRCRDQLLAARRFSRVSQGHHTRFLRSFSSVTPTPIAPISCSR
jgi:DNA-binding transcriptional ArsR family regulator